ncbi:hypothetical protein [Escherichia coli]|uniref:hypothetical protein n=1 Tax=Escherichia coli TaxID=562 RepID=UPI003F49442E
MEASTSKINKNLPKAQKQEETICWLLNCSSSSITNSVEWLFDSMEFSSGCCSAQLMRCEWSEGSDECQAALGAGRAT